MLFIFDMGGVVSGNVHTLPLMAEKLGVSLDDFFVFCGVPENTALKHRYDFGLLADIQAGRIDSVRFWELFRKNAMALLADRDPAANRIRMITLRENLWDTCFHPEMMAGTVAVIAALKKKGHRVVCGTNTLDAHYAVHSENGDYDVFDSVYASHLMGVIKPHREFWDSILASEKIPCGEAVFIDDNEPNVTAAQKTGIASILFTSAESLKAGLAEYLA